MKPVSNTPRKSEIPENVETGWRHSLVSVKYSGIKTFLVSGKRYSKVDINVLQFCPILLDIFIAF